MESRFLLRPAFMACGIFFVLLGSWEWYLRKDGANLAVDDDASLWAHVRQAVNDPDPEKTVFIGSSRIKFDLDVPTYELITGEKAVQLACQGSSPLPILHDLASDATFAGKLVIDVTEGLFFSNAPHNVEMPNRYLNYYHDLTPAQRASFVINRPLERTFVFLDKENYSINALLDKLELKSREGVFMFPIFPRDFDRAAITRQSSMTPAFAADSNQYNRQRAAWQKLSLRRRPPITGGPLDTMFMNVKSDVDRITQRGGKIIFVRTPSSGPFWEGEQKGYPRELYWDRLLRETGQPGIHFNDYPETNHYICPEFSHLSPTDAIDYTKHLIRQMESKGWSFPNSQPK
jgi:hypothetical protein